jgi:hypothetical protein
MTYRINQTSVTIYGTCHRCSGVTITDHYVRQDDHIRSITDCLGCGSHDDTGWELPA